jgi:hypothetical protein
MIIGPFGMIMITSRATSVFPGAATGVTVSNWGTLLCWTKIEGSGMSASCEAALVTPGAAPVTSGVTPRPDANGSGGILTGIWTKLAELIAASGPDWHWILAFDAWWQYCGFNVSIKELRPPSGAEGRVQVTVLLAVSAQYEGKSIPVSEEGQWWFLALDEYRLTCSRGGDDEGRNEWQNGDVEFEMHLGLRETS